MSCYKPCFWGSDLYALYPMPTREEITADETVRSALSWSGGKDSTLTLSRQRDCAAGLSSHGFARISGPFGTSDETFDVAGALVETCQLEHSLPPLSVIGDFVLPPLDGGETRDFQTLHFDFGLPLDPKVEGDIARYTALHIPADVTGVRAVTRLVPLAALLAQRSWPAPAELLEQLRSYGRTHGAWDDEEGYVEGSLARIVEAAAAERSPILPSVKAEPGFLCGLEFDSLSSELAFFAGHGLRIEDAEIEINLQPGELLLFDNLTLAHGRRGTRQPGELRQRVYGHRLHSADQRKVRDHVLTAFHMRAGR
jgi:Taurine catabolism dioxygenase TauD, TfdA family